MTESMSACWCLQTLCCCLALPLGMLARTTPCKSAAALRWSMLRSYADSVPFGGYKMSGLGRNKGEYALENYTQVRERFCSMRAIRYMVRWAYITG